MSNHIATSTALLFLIRTLLCAENVKRVHWTYRNDHGTGYFKETGSNKWMERLPQGGVCFFKETVQNTEFVEIYDSSRGQVWVRMYLTRSYWKHPKLTRGEWRTLWAGSWTHSVLTSSRGNNTTWAKADPRRLKFLYRESDKSPAIFVSRGTYWLNFAQGREHRFRLIARNDQFIELRKDEQRNNVRIYFGGACIRQQHSGQWISLGQGKGQFAQQKHTTR